MSHDLYWSRPPAEPERDSPLTDATKSLVISAITSEPRSKLDGPTEIRKNSVIYHYLRGAGDYHPDSEVADDLARLLRVADTHGAVQVWTEAG